MVDLKLNAEVLALIAVSSALLLFYLYHYAVNRKIIFIHLLRPVFPSGSTESLEFLSEKLTGILFTGIIPFIVFVLILNVLPSKIGFITGRTFHVWYLILALILITAFVSYTESKSRKIQKISPELKLKTWYPRHIILSASAWICYIFGYEFFFRGVLWFLCREAFGFWPALVINLLLYSLVHLPEGKLMAIGTIPAGMVFCLLSELTGSFFPAFLIHSSIAIMTELFSLYHNHSIQIHFTRIAG
jgi:uncharacterized protein